MICDVDAYESSRINIEKLKHGNLKFNIRKKPLDMSGFLFTFF